MKVLLTTLPSRFLDDDRTFPQLGILYLLSAAKAVGHKVRYVPHPAMIYPDHDLHYTDVVAHSAMSYEQYDREKQLVGEKYSARHFRKRRPGHVRGSIEQNMRVGFDGNPACGPK